MNTKILLAAAALFIAAAPAFAQTGVENDKTKTVVDGMKTKTKMAEDGKMKVKGKDDAGNQMKATTKPYKGKMAREMNGDATSNKKHHGMKHHKDMKGDSTKSGSM
ncbi:MAG: hypothetical protein EOO56_23795 [Hymenobacter sp.]|nr:MAG: hypothetical protein EOO56_23795 [Hymenobacter sp.]